MTLPDGRLGPVTVLYDAGCAVCRRARAWLEAQPQQVPLSFVPAASPQARALFPGLDPTATLRDLTVVAADGRVWHAEAAWVVALWCLSEHRALAERLAQPALLPTVRGVVAAIGAGRHAASALLPDG